VNDRRASLDEETTIRKLVETEFARGANIPVVAFPEDSAAIQDSPRLTLVLVEPETEWKDGGHLAGRVSQWTKDRGKSPRLYPGFCSRRARIQSGPIYSRSAGFS
jgi:hypothetical protein